MSVTAGGPSPCYLDNLQLSAAAPTDLKAVEGVARAAVVTAASAPAENGAPPAAAGLRSCAATCAPLVADRGPRL